MEHPILSENEKIAMRVAGESTSRITTLDGRDAKDIIAERNVKKFNEEVDSFAEKFEKHSTNLTEFADKVNKNVENIEIMPIGNYVLCKQFDENPFQRIVRDSQSGLILDLGGMKPQYKNTDNGEIEEEEQFIKVGVIQEVGPECKWCIPGDTIFFTKPSAVPVPFYKQGLQLVCENRVLAVVNEQLSTRFEEIKNEQNSEWINVNELPDFIKGTIEERLEKWKAYKKMGFKFIQK
jgi:hypothetical protein